MQPYSIVGGATESKHSTKGYVRRTVHIPLASRNPLLPRATRKIYMHRAIMLAGPDDVVDHLNGNGLDNRRANLRITNKSRNAQRALIDTVRPNKHGFRGVAPLGKRSKRWRARISVDGKEIHLGTYTTKEEAARAYDVAAGLHYGIHAYLNFPPDIT